MNFITGDTDPEFVNDEGFKWYRPKIFAERAKRLGVAVFLVADANDNPKAWIAIDSSTNAVVHENAQVEGMAVYLDMLIANKELR